MSERDPRRLAVGAAAALLLVALAAWYLARPRPSAAAPGAPPPAAISVSGAGTGGGGRAVVDVSGAVRHPGVYRLSAGSRVEDALKRAGGATRRADLTQVNRAAKVEDGRQILVPVRAAAGGAAPAGAGPAPGGTPAAPLNLNTATAEQLDTLDGVGPATAQKILDYRKAHNGFGSVDELDQVPGIGPKRLADLREHLRV